jgi:hypothetical protein
MRQDNRERIEDLKNQFEYLKTKRKKREADWKEVQKFVAPSVFSWDNPHDKTPKRPRRFTSRPTHFLKTLRSGIIGYSISPNIVWQKLGFENLAHLNLHGAKDWLEEVERVLYAEFKRSNLYPQVGKFVEYAAAYGHAVMLIDEQIAENRLRFSTCMTAELYLDINEYDEADTVFRYFSITLRNAAAFFGEAQLSEARQADLKDKKKWNQEIAVIHAVYRRQEFDPDSPAANNMPYASVYIDEGQDHILMESGYNEFPYAVFVWDQINGSAYGESPAINALDDIKLLNRHEEARIKIAQSSAEPFYNVPDSMKGPISVVPNGFNYYTHPDEIIKPVQTGFNYPITLEVTREIENRIKDWFHVDFFLVLQQQQPANMTATYVMELQGEKASTLSSLVVNINAALAKIIQRSFNLLWRQRKIPAPPRSLASSGAQLKVDFTGPLAQAQKKYHESGGITQGISLIAALARIAPPEALDVVNFDQTLKAGLEGAGFPQNAINEDRDIEEIRMVRAAQQAQLQQQALAIEQQKTILGNYNKLNEPVQPGSALDGLNRQLRGAEG